MQILLRDLASGGTQYVRIALGGTAVSGVDPALADGLDPADVLALEERVFLLQVRAATGSYPGGS